MALEALTTEQVEFYEREGYLVLENRVPMSIIEDVRAEIKRFETEARGMTASNDRIDLEDSHTPDAPRVRRIKFPHQVSDVMRDLLHSDQILAPVRDLCGPNLRLNTTKLNMKSAQYGAAVEWHQDWAFYPQTNDDVLAIGVLIDDLLPENGPLMVFPGSHKGPTFDHHNIDGVFSGAMDLGENSLNMDDAVMLTGPAGSITIHHARTVHGSALNTSDFDRRLLFYEMMAADAFPLVGSLARFDNFDEYKSRILCGEHPDQPRLVDTQIRLPIPTPSDLGSIYEIQKNAKSRPLAGTS